MGGPATTRPVEEGADTAVWLADEAPRELTGRCSRTGEESRGRLFRLILVRAIQIVIRPPTGLFRGVYSGDPRETGDGI